MIINLVILNMLLEKLKLKSRHKRKKYFFKQTKKKLKNSYIGHELKY